MRNHQHSSAAALAAAIATLGVVAPGAVWADDTTTPAPAAPAPAAPAATPPPNYNVQTAGFLDGYYLYQFNNPKNAIITGRTYDFRHNTPTLALAELNVFKTPKPGGFGFKTTLGAGDIADVNAGGFPTAAGYVDSLSKYEGRYKSLLQAYGTYSAASGAGIDFGKFYTPFGYEVTESNANFNESHSLAFALLPFYHTGIRVYTPSLKGFTGTAYVVRSLFNSPTAGVGDDNSSLAYILSLNYTDPKGKFTAIESIGGGKDKFNLVAGDTSSQIGGPGTDNKNLVSDTDFTYNFTASTILGLNYTYVKTDPDSNSAGVKKATGNGYAVYFKQILTPKTDYALRFSANEIKSDALTKSTKPWEVTATYDIKTAANFTTRFEYRHDGSNVDSFVDSSGNVIKKNQDTLMVAGNFTF